MPGIAGNLLGFKANGAFANCETQCSIKFDRDLLPASAEDSGNWKEYLYGIRGWSISVDGNLLLEAVPNDIKTLLRTGYFRDFPTYVQFSTAEGSNLELIYSGNALFQSGSITAPGQGKANWTVTMQGTGALTVKQQDYSLIINAMPIVADYPLIVNTRV